MRTRTLRLEVSPARLASQVEPVRSIERAPAPARDPARVDDSVTILQFAIVLGIAALSVAAYLYAQRDPLEHACAMAHPRACERLEVYIRAFGWLATSGAAMLLTVFLAWALRGDDRELLADETVQRRRPFSSAP